MSANKSTAVPYVLLSSEDKNEWSLSHMPWCNITMITSINDNVSKCCQHFVSNFGKSVLHAINMQYNYQRDLCWLKHTTIHICHITWQSVVTVILTENSSNYHDICSIDDSNFRAIILKIISLYTYILLIWLHYYY